MTLMIFKIVWLASMLIVLVYFINRLQKQKIRYEKKREKLLNAIHSTRQKQISLNEKVKLSEEFAKNYKDSRNKIAQTIYEANYEMIKSITAEK